ncbi:hypothetical protein [Paenibacillus sp. FSL R7-0337]
MTISSIEGNRYSPSLILAFEIARLFDKVNCRSVPLCNP